MAISMRSVIAGLIKLILFFAFYMAGWLTNSQLNQYTIVSQQDRINSLENETALQRLQINELNRRATSNTESIKHRIYQTAYENPARPGDLEIRGAETARD